MNPEKQARLAKAGWKVGTAAELLGLSSAEAAYVELRLRLSDAVRGLRRKKKLSQTALAGMMGSSQSRVAKLEAADETVSLDLMVRSLLTMGASNADLARIIGDRAERR
jgi:DNA-binding XRE family transcriptional regulator